MPTTREWPMHDEPQDMIHVCREDVHVLYDISGVGSSHHYLSLSLACPFPSFSFVQHVGLSRAEILQNACC